MITLGLSIFADSSAGIIKDGEILCAVEEERLNRIKHYEGLPRLSVLECLNNAGLDYKEIDRIAIGWNPLKGWTRRIGVSLISSFFDMQFFTRKLLRGDNYIKGCKNILFLNKILGQDIKSNFQKKKIKYVNHHLAHSASAYLTSPFESANIIVADGIGESETISFFTGHENRINKIKSIKYPHSLGHLYASITGFLGFKMTSDEGKVMALASYGEDTYRELFDDLVKTDYENGTFRLNIKLLDYHLARNGIFKDEFIKKTGLGQRKKDGEINKKHKDLACSLQRCIERVIFLLLRKSFPDAVGKPLCAAGGLFLNSVLNGKILTEFTDKYYVFPAAGDNGVSVGSALYLNSFGNSNFKKQILNDLSLGRLYGEEEILKALKSYPVKYNKSQNIFDDTANLIVSGKVIGWFSGRMEFGPRALGSRSILASALSDKMKEKVNSKIKHREEFRPFACAVLRDEADNYFENFQDSVFMLKVFRFKKSFANTFPAVSHVDNTCRIQTVTETNNPRFYKLLLKIKELSGYGIVLNTSMNDNGQPIVNTPIEAVELLLKTDIEAMILENYMVTKL
jgi:carbamoyltransferase